MINRIKKHFYPYYRDPDFNPRCYELTEEERQRAIRTLDAQLKGKKNLQYDKTFSKLGNDIYKLNSTESL